MPLLRLAFAVLLSVSSLRPAEKRVIDFGRDIRPILSENCFHCHGQDSRTRMANLRLDTFEGATRDRGGRAALVPGKPEQSGIHQRITAATPALRMPPAQSNRKLTPEQIALLTRWIAEGGQYARHWSFVPPRRPALPKAAGARWNRQPIDAFVLDRLESEGLRPSPAAAPAVWLRRASLDLTGLPPSPAVVGAFEKDVAARGEAAYEAAADRLLASPRYGERMAMDWLDVARYADTHGFNNDASRSMWRWRDWVIEAFNANMPYDRFLTEQLAGDLLPDPTLDQRIATGYGRNHVINSEGGIIDEEYRVEYVADRVRTLGMSWLGLTLECARCHDHKYDPYTQRDYYRFFAFFNNVPEIGEDGRVGNAVPILPAPTREQQARIRELEDAIAALEANMRRREAPWRWRPADAARVRALAAAAKVPEAPAASLDCEAGPDFHRSEGVAGQACAGLVDGARPALPPVPVSRRTPFTLSVWVNPSPRDADAPLLSSADYARNRASTGWGGGIDLRLIEGEVEFRFGQRYPAYSMVVRSQGSRIAAGKWTHVALVFSGASPGANRAYASWVRLFADGREVALRVLNDGAQIEAKADKPPQVKLRLGWDNSPGGARFAGRLDEVSVWPRALSPAEVAAVFSSTGLPHAAAAGGPVEWLRDAILPLEDAGYAEAAAQRARLHAELLALRRDVPFVMVMEEMAPPRRTHVLLRGAYNAPGESVEPGVPEDLLGAWPAGAPKNRLGLAKWLTRPDHPLTARVVVNRFWQQLFGQGLVRTSENFGLQGEWPSHPDLLDWLAREFVDSGWDVKALLRRIVLSAAYRQDSAASPALLARDPENRLLARGPRFRLPAEVIRDQALEIAGLLRHRLGGPSVYPFQPADLYKGMVVAADYPGTTWTESTGEDLHRRSLYTFWKRTVPHPTMTVFDAPDREFCVVRRSTTNTPLQALTLLNDPIFVEASRRFAGRILREGGTTTASRLDFAFRLATGRPPDARERAILQSTFDRMLAGLPGAGTAEAELTAYTMVANMILNLDEVLTKG